MSKGDAKIQAHFTVTVLNKEYDNEVLEMIL